MSDSNNASNGSGRIAQCADPQGALFAVASGAPES